MNETRDVRVFKGGNVEKLFFHPQVIFQDFVMDLEIDEDNRIQNFITCLDRKPRLKWMEIEDKALTKGNTITDNEGGY